MSLLSLVFAASLAAGNAEFEQASTDAAADIALGRLKMQIAEQGLATNYLERTMLADPAAYRTRAEAENRCRELYRAELVRTYREKADEILRELGSGRTAAEPDTNALEDVTARLFPKAFAADRAAACSAQAKGIALKVKPDEADLEAKGEDELRTWLTDRIAHARGTPVFEENLKFISKKIVDPILADARKERKRQQEYLMRTRADAFAPDALARELEANLRKNVAERKAKCEDPERAWNVFPGALRTALTNAVERRLLAVVAKETDAVPFAVDPDEVRKIILADPLDHRNPAESEKIFRDRYAKNLLACAVIQAEQSVPAAERAAFGEYVRAREKAGELTRAVDARLKRDTLPKWRAARTEIAQAEAQRLWPTLSDRTWFPESELADRLAARSDYSDAVRNWRDISELNAFADAGARALNESSAAADKSIAAAFDLARNAIAAQRAIVGEACPRILEAAKDRSKGLFTSTPNLEGVIEMLTKEVEAAWAEKRLELLWGNRPRPANADSHHTELFPSVKREIELVARQILEETEKREKAETEAEKEERPTPEETKPEPPKPEEPEPPTESDSSSSSDSQTDMELCTISFKVSGSQVTVQAMKGKTVIAERNAKATAKGFEDAVRQVGAVVGREIFKLK